MGERVYCECPDADRGRHVTGCLFADAATDPRLDGYQDFLLAPSPADAPSDEETEYYPLPTTMRELVKLSRLVSDCHVAVNTDAGRETVIAALHALGGYATDMVLKWDRSLQAHLTTQRISLTASGFSEVPEP